MKQIILLFTLTLLSVHHMNAIPTIEIKEEYSHSSGLPEDQLKFYKISESEAIQLNATDYEPSIPSKLEGKKVNTIMIVAGGGQFSLPWEEKRKSYTISKETLGDKFSGFSKGKAVIALGILENNNFSVVWVGMINVQSKTEDNQPEQDNPITRP
jgi:hypothetical protein